jgi:hypothetical protein
MFQHEQFADNSIGSKGWNGKKEDTKNTIKQGLDRHRDTPQGNEFGWVCCGRRNDYTRCETYNPYGLVANTSTNVECTACGHHIHHLTRNPPRCGTCFKVTALGSAALFVAANINDKVMSRGFFLWSWVCLNDNEGCRRLRRCTCSNRNLRYLLVLR